jgi:pimeloyl-ACP methyl ester carboxylesterase
MSGTVMRIIGVLLMLTALGLSLSRAPERPVETLVARWAQPPSDFVDIKGMVVHLRDEGPRDDPLPIVLLHGTAASLHTWEGWVRALKTERRVISFDLPGFGLTGPFAGTYAATNAASDGDSGTAGDYRGDSYARFVLDLMAHLKIDLAVLAGNSLGGEIAWRVATLAPHRVASLVLVDASGLALPPQSVPTVLSVARTPGVEPHREWVLPRSLVRRVWPMCMGTLPGSLRIWSTAISNWPCAKATAERWGSACGSCSRVRMPRASTRSGSRR